MPSSKKVSRPTRKWEPAPPELVQLFQRMLRHVRRVQMRKMFGYPAAFLNGQMMAGLFQNRMMLRLSADDRASFLELRGATPFEPMPGRLMREYVTVPDWILGSEKELQSWLAKAAAFVETLPPRLAKTERPQTRKR